MIWYFWRKLSPLKQNKITKYLFCVNTFHIHKLRYINEKNFKKVPVLDNFEHFEQIAKQRLGEKAIKFRESWQSFLFLPFVLLLLLHQALPFIPTNMSTYVSYCHSMQRQRQAGPNQAGKSCLYLGLSKNKFWGPLGECLRCGGSCTIRNQKLGTT